MNMNFIENFLGLSPDNNTGSTEAAIFLALSLGLSLLYSWFRFKRPRV
jgi:hypothetical protein